MRDTMKIFSILVALSTPVLCSKLAVAPYYSIRSQGTDIARDLAGQTPYIHLFNQENNYSVLSITAEYTRSFNAKAIAQSLFGADAHTDTACKGAQIVVSGTRTAHRGNNDWLADYFYLPTDFKSILNFEPRIENVIADLSLYVGFDKWLPGLFFEMHAPINWTRWNLNFHEEIINEGVNAYSDGYFTASAMPRNDLLNNFAEFARGKSPNQFIDVNHPRFAIPLITFNGFQNNVSPSYDITFDGLCNAKFDTHAMTRTSLATLALILGYDVVNRENYYVGLGVKCAAPTGNHPTGELLFEPISGNGGHWEIGARVASHALLFKSCSEESHLDFYCFADITHLLKSHQSRIFDLKNKPLSRYMLAEKMGPPFYTFFDDNNELLLNMPGFQNEYSPIANLTKQEMLVSITVQADIAAQLTYTRHGFNWDIGYNFWTRSCESFYLKNNDCEPLLPSCGTVCEPACSATFKENSWAIKGDAQVFGFTRSSNASPINEIAIPLSSTESVATINAGTNIPATGLTDPTAAQLTNPNVDNAELVPFIFLFSTTGYPPQSSSDRESARINSSNPPILIKETDFNRIGTRSTSHKIYTNITYNWQPCGHFAPYMGFGGFGEFGSNNTCTAHCLKCSLSQWGAWIKFGISFN
ncbi:MAG: hypothetical protein NTX86_02415 [Candidatus Dependentiae bacterium]|nr:hypothetical protein [Candidatus Dependentiae bacterium]